MEDDFQLGLVTEIESRNAAAVGFTLPMVWPEVSIREKS
jgi:hypothetical protein